MRDIEILGNKVTDLSAQELFAELDATVRNARSEVILNTNIHGILLSQRLPWLREYRNSVRITHCDGAGVVLGARILGHEMGPRVSMNDLFWDFIALCSRRGYSLFLLGATPEVIDRAVQAVREREPNLRLVGHHHGYFAKQGPETDAIIELVNRAKPTVLLVGFGMPIQEAWVRDNAHRLQVNVIWVVGGLFDLVSGILPLAPPWVRKHGLEWLHLSLWRPRRFFQRYLVGNPRFLLQVLFERLGLRHYAAQGASHRRTGS